MSNLYDKVEQVVKEFNKSNKKHNCRAVYVGSAVWDEITQDPAFKVKGQLESAFKTASIEGIQIFPDTDPECDKNAIYASADFKS
mgnify:CR=1 FL=1